MGNTVKHLTMSLGLSSNLFRLWDQARGSACWWFLNSTQVLIWVDLHHGCVYQMLGYAPWPQELCLSYLFEAPASACLSMLVPWL